MATPIHLMIPGTLAYRDVAVRAVAEAARVVSHAAPRDTQEAFDTAIVSAFMEIYNNIATHAYAADASGPIEIAMTPSADGLVIAMTDHGAPFDPREVPQLPPVRDAASLPEGGMGLHIAGAMLDEIHYRPGPPNHWRLCKRLSPGRT